MNEDDISDPAGDPFYPPAIPTLVGCLHCGEEYESYLIEWRTRTGLDGKQHGVWCCPTEGCDGIGFGFDILPVDKDFEDERGGCWIGGEDDEEEEEEVEFPSFEEDEIDEDASPKRDRPDEELPW